MPNLPKIEDQGPFWRMTFIDSTPKEKKMTNQPTRSPVALPPVAQFTTPMLQALTNALGIRRDVLATDDQIESALQSLPKLLSAIPLKNRDEGIMRMCVAVASGLFDSAVNYAWNAAIVELRMKVRRFGISIIPQIIAKDFDEQALKDMQDSELLTLCLKLNLVSETGFFMLSQCRDIRNNFSAAHPAVGNLDEYEFIGFLNRCARHAFSDEQNLTAVDIKEFMQVIDAGSFTPEQHGIWCDRIAQTFDAQREAIIRMLHGIYCDPSKKQYVRVTAAAICQNFVKLFTPSIVSELINQHQKYLAAGDQERIAASQTFFTNLDQLQLLSESERHSMISLACQNLFNVHNAMDNFHNESPFAERLAKLSSGHKMPDTVRSEFVATVVTCSVGNGYGTSNSADGYYQSIIRGFSPRAIEIMLSLPNQDTLVGYRIKNFPRCKTKFMQIANLLNADSIPTKLKSSFGEWFQE